MRRISASSADCLSLVTVGEKGAAKLRSSVTAACTFALIIAPSPSLAGSQIASCCIEKLAFRRGLEAAPHHAHQQTKLFRDSGLLICSARERRGSTCAARPPTDPRACLPARTRLPDPNH